MDGLVVEKQQRLLSMMNTHNFIIVSYFTLDTPYAKIAHECLMPTLNHGRIESDVRGVDNLGSWMKNTSFKPAFIKMMLEQHCDSNIVWVDCDAEIVRFPSMFIHIPDEYDVAVHYLDRDKWYSNGNTGKELLSGTVFFRNNENSMRIVDKWKDECSKNEEWDQKVLQRVLEGEKVFELPIEYCYIKTMPDGSQPRVGVLEPVILHNQASRKLRDIIR